jgi:hypothetical protein
MPSCPACGGQRNSYHTICYNCEPVLDDYFVSAEGHASKMPPFTKLTTKYDIGYTERVYMPRVTCPAGEVLPQAIGEEMVHCQIAVQVQPDAKVFPIASCAGDYTKCQLWRTAKDKGWA